MKIDIAYILKMTKLIGREILMFIGMGTVMIWIIKRGG